MTTPIKLPDKYVDRRGIIHKKPGTWGWMVPWAVEVSAEGYMYVNGLFDLHGQRGGTVSMRVQRTEDGVRIEARTLGTYRRRSNLRVVLKGSGMLPVEELF